LKQSQKTILLWLFLILMFVGIYKLFTGDTNQPETQDVAWLKAELAAEDRAKNIDKVEIQPKGRDDARYLLSYKNSSNRVEVFGPYAGAGNDITTALDKYSISWTVKSKDESAFWQTLFVSWLPMLFLFVIFFFFMRQLQAGGGKAMSFGKSKAKLLTDHQNKITFKDVAGVEEAKDEVEEIIAFLKDPKKFTRLGGRIPKGVLMMGPPGTGKTLLARAIAGEAGVPFFSISGSDFVEMFVGVGASRVRDLFEQGKKNAPCIIFIDEIDAVGRHRGAGLGGGHDEREQTLNQLLVEMDGFESNDGVILIAATNRPDVLDPALLRPGRFDRRIIVGLPDVRGREMILSVHTRKVPISDDVELSIIARGTPGFSGADLENLVNEAALLAARDDRDRVASRDFERAKDKVLMGAERKSVMLSDDEKRTTAWHEAGHTLVAMLLPKQHVDPIHKVTIIPRGQALGVTQQLPEEDRHNIDRRYAEARIAILMGGRIAEEVALGGQQTTGAGNDIDTATNMARRMICEWGMSDTLGPIAYGNSDSEPFLGRDIQKKQNYSEATAQAIDREVTQLIMTQYERAKNIVVTHRDALERLALALIERESLGIEEVQAAIAGRALPPIAKPPRAASADETQPLRPSEQPEPTVGGSFPVAEPST
jgi:cell division protease FtsH